MIEKSITIKVFTKEFGKVITDTLKNSVYLSFGVFIALLQISAGFAFINLPAILLHFFKDSILTTMSHADMLYWFTLTMCLWGAFWFLAVHRLKTRLEKIKKENANVMEGEFTVNVAKTYLDMCKEQGLSDRESTRILCEAVGLKFSASYAKEWARTDKDSRSIPPAVVKEMQKRTAVYTANKLGIEITDKKALLFAEMLSPKIKL